MMSSIEPSLWYTAMLTALLVAGCDTGEPAASAEADPSEISTAAGPAETLTLELALPADTDPELVEAIAKSAEQHAGPAVAGAQVKAKQRGEGPLILEVELWGELDDEAVILERLRAEHEILKLTPVAVERLAGAPSQGDMDRLDGLDAQFAEDATPEEIEAQVRERLIAAGHDLEDADVHVAVSEGEDGHRRVEIRVEQETNETRENPDDE